MLSSHSIVADDNIRLGAKKIPSLLVGEGKIKIISPSLCPSHQGREIWSASRQRRDA
jgi:hypothetical protein